MQDLLSSVWRYRYFIVSSVRNELRARFARSKLGGLWMIIHPLAQVLIFALVLSEVLAAKLPGIDNKYAYSLYLMAGIFGWTLFSETITRCLTLFIDNGNLMKKMAFPRVCLPVIATGNVLVNGVLLLIAIFGVFAALGHFPDAQVLWLPLVILVTMTAALALGLILGIANVFMRDVGQVVPVILQVMFWLTPIVYSLEALPDAGRAWLRWNPLYPLMASFQNVLVFGRPPLLDQLAWIMSLSLLLLALALGLFRRANAELVDAL